MSASVNGDTASLESKKRKSTNKTLESSKKRRKHENVEDHNEPFQETVSLEDKKKDKSDKKDKKDKKDKSDKKDKKDKIEKREKKGKKDKKQREQLSESAEVENVETFEPPSAEASPAAELIPNPELEVDDISMMDAVEEVVDDSLLQSQQPSCFYEKRLSLQLPIPGISLRSSTASLLSLHLAPLLLTYFAPADGIVLSFSDPVISATPSYGVNLPLKPPKSGEIPRNPPDETFARCADQFGVCWVWLTVTFLIFRPDAGDELKAWTNVASEGFIGLVSYNYFQAAVGKNRIPKTWSWDGPTRESSKNHKKKARKEKLRDENGISGSQDDARDTMQENDGVVGLSGSFLDADGNKVPSTQIFRVVDVEMVPGHEKDRWTLQIDGSLLPSDEEEEVLQEERRRFDRAYSRSKTPGPDEESMPMMSGDVSFSRATSPS